jgi:hypothetical protein
LIALYLGVLLVWKGQSYFDGNSTVVAQDEKQCIASAKSVVTTIDVIILSMLKNNLFFWYFVMILILGLLSVLVRIEFVISYNHSIYPLL